VRLAGFRVEAVPGEAVHGSVDIADFPTQVVQPLAAFAEMVVERMLWGERLDELEPDVTHVEVGETDAGASDFFAEQEGEPEPVPVKSERVLRVPHYDSNMIDLFEHVPI